MHNRTQTFIVARTTGMITPTQVFRSTGGYTLSLKCIEFLYFGYIYFLLILQENLYVNFTCSYIA